jgi:tricorn protease
MIDLGRLRIEVVPAEEWRQMFLEAWRLQRDHFWVESMAGIDWRAVRDRFLPLLGRVATRSELSDLIWELQGELGTSHAYEFGGDYPERTSYPVGNLGADLRWDGQGYVVERVPKGDAWNAKAASPLGAPGVNVTEGDRILMVGGRSVSEAEPPSALLVHEASTDVELTVEPKAGGAPRRVVVRTLGSERQLRYRDWVRRKRAHVDERSKGALGYLHIPDMGGYGLSEFFRAYRSQSKRPGLVVDVRNNGGGFVSQLVIEHLRRRVIGYDRPRYGRTESYPFDAVRGPLVAICDQFAGSDGDIFCHAFRRYALGPIVGTRTWGGVVGIDLDVDKHLADGTIVTQPEYGSYFEGVGWNVENHGVEPDVEVVMDPATMARGEDPQLDRAIDLALEALQTQPVREPEWPEVPSRRY